MQLKELYCIVSDRCGWLLQLWYGVLESIGEYSLVKKSQLVICEVLGLYTIIDRNQGMDNHPYHFEYDDKTFKITCFKTHFQEQRTLLIERDTCRIKDINCLLPNLAHSKKLAIHLLVGILIIHEEPFLTLVTSVAPVALIFNEPIYQIKDISFVAFRKGFNEKLFNYAEIAKDIESVKENIINDNFYFCYNYNLTLTMQKHKQGLDVERMFFWNQAMLTELKAYDVSSCWMIPVVQGFIRGFKAETLYFPYDYTLISRRSKYQSGTRFTSRGVNSEGHVANFVETEEIYCFHRVAISWVQLRGSVPLFWGQSGFGALVNVAETSNQSVILQKHMKLLESTYKGSIMTIDLLSDKEGGTVGEHVLQRKFEELYREVCGSSYVNFDLNKEVSRNKSDVQAVIDRFVHKNSCSLIGDFFAEDHCENIPLNSQTLFIRVNCLDCLDRTNVIQFKASEKMMREFEVFLNSKADMEEKKVVFDESFREKHRELWASMGDKISLIYSGTTSVASYLTKGEKSKNFFNSLGNGLKSLNRMYNANVNDNYKQQCIDWVLRQSEDTKTHFFEDSISLKLNETEFCEIEEINLSILSWNCAQISPTEIDLGILLEMPAQPEILVICLQEVIELSTYNVLLGGSKGVENKWRQSIENLMKYHDKNMVFVGQKDLVGVLTLVFVSQKHLDRISSVVWSEIKTGFKGNLGNKGSVALSFKFEDSVITLFNCHLEAGEGKMVERLYNMEYIHNNCFSSRKDWRQYMKSDFKFLVGDLNFRIDLNAEEVREALYHIEKEHKNNPLFNLGKSLEPLLALDELNNSRPKHEVLSAYTQSPICFLPSYKFVKRSNQYDYKRVPSWCDRILYCSNPLKLMVKSYSRKENIHNSDHKPIFGVFNILVNKENYHKKKQLTDAFMKW